MDRSSQDVASFLGALQDVMHRLGRIHGDYVRRGTFPRRPFLTLSGRPFTVLEEGSSRKFAGCVAMGLSVAGSDAKEYELVVDIMWNEQCWTISTEAWVEADEGGQFLLRQIPERTAVDLGACLKEITAAIEDLVGFVDLVPGK